MADEIPGSSPTPPAPPTVDYYEKIVERSHKEIEWVRSAYKWLGTFIAIVGAFIIGGITVLTFKTIDDLGKKVDDIKKRAQEDVEFHINKRILEQFAEPNIQKKLEEIAKKRASEMIEAHINPTINEAKDRINNLQGELRQDIERIRAELEKELAGPRKYLENRKTISDIHHLRDMAIKDCGDYSSYKAIANYFQTNADTEVKEAVLNAKKKFSISFMVGYFFGICQIPQQAK